MKYLVSLIIAASSLFVTNASAELVNINKASAEVIQDNLKGIGAKKAEAIIAYRTEHGEFKKLEDIKEVKGIGDAIFEKNKADMSLDQGLSTTGAAGAEGKTEADKKPEDKLAKPEVKAAKEAPKKDKELAE